MMPSHLTRGVFRRLLASRPVVYHRPIHSASRPRLWTIRTSRPTQWHSARRSIFGFGQNNAKRDIREPLLDPGMEKMLELDKRINLVARLPPNEELASAYMKFILSKQDPSQKIEDFNAVLVLQTLKVLELGNTFGTDIGVGEIDDGKSEPPLNAAALDKSLKVLSQGQHRLTAVHTEMARLVYFGLMKRTDKNETDAAEEIRLERFASILARTGNAVEARDLLAEFWKQTHPTFKGKTGPWARILDGLAQEGNEKELLKTLDIMKEMSMPVSPKCRAAVALFYARKNDISETKRWFTKDVIQIRFGNNDKYQLDWSEENIQRVLFEFCLRNNELEWGQSLLTTGELDKTELHTLNAIFQAAAASGKGADLIDQMISVAVRQSGDEDAKPDVSIFNGLITYAISRNDPYGAERFNSLITKWGLEPDATTYELQVRYRLLANDHEGAMAAYDNLKKIDEKSTEIFWVANAMVQKFVDNPSISRDTIIELAADISEFRRLFPAETVAALSVYHINKDEYFEAVDLLQTYAFQYSSEQRKRICDLLVAISLDPKSDSSKIWDTYMVWHQVFDRETKTDIRNKIMGIMYEHQRPDLGTHVFTRMMRHIRKDTHPDANSYVEAFVGISKTADPDALEVVHNVLKLDTDVEPNTRIRNALMMALIACDVGPKALEVWQTIAQSQEGPSIESIHIALYACKTLPFGDQFAKTIWDRLVEAETEIDEQLVISYIETLAGNYKLTEAKQMAENSHSLCGVQPNIMMLGTAFNAIRGVTQQEDFEDWIKDEYPDVWNEMERKGFEETEMGFRNVRGVARQLKP